MRTDNLLHKYLQSWIASLNATIGDTYEEIANRRADNILAVNVRDDLLALIEYIERNELPEAVRRGLERSLKWNPYCTGAIRIKGRGDD